MAMEVDKLKFIGAKKVFGLGIGWNDAKNKIKGGAESSLLEDIKALEDDLKKEPENEDKKLRLFNCYELLSRLYQMNGMDKEAQEYSGKATSLGTYPSEKSLICSLYGDSERGLLELLKIREAAFNANKNDITAKENLANTYMELGKVNLRNGMTSKAREYLKLAEKTGPSKNDGPEIYNLLTKVIDPITDWQVRCEYSPQKISTLSYEPLKGPMPWDEISYRSDGRPGFRARPSSYDAYGLNIGFDSPPITLYGPPQIQVGGSLSGVEGAIEDVRFPWYVYPDKYTPQEMKDLNGTMCTAAEFGPLCTQNLYANLTFPMMPAYKWMGPVSPVPLLLMNKIGVGYNLAGTSVGITTYNYTYNDTFHRLDFSIGDEGTFRSLRQDFSIFGETQTVHLPLGLDWPYAFYTSVFYGYKASYLSHMSMPDIYYLSDKGYVAPTYFMNIPFTDDENDLSDERDLMRADYRTFTDERKRLAEGREPKANEYTIGTRISIPGPMLWMKLFGLVEQGKMENETEEAVKFTLATSRVRHDSISNTSNGIYPSTRDVYAPYEKYVRGDLNHNNVQEDTPAYKETWARNEDGKWIYDPAAKSNGGKDFHELIDPVNSDTWNIGMSYKMTVGHLSKMVTPLDYGAPWSKEFWTGYFDSECAGFKGIIFKGIGRGLWLLPSIPYSLFDQVLLDIVSPRALTRRIGGVPEPDNTKKEIPVYVPLECSFGGVTAHGVRDINTGIKGDRTGSSRMLGVGLGIGENFQVMYRKGSADNGMGWKSTMHSIMLTIKFKL